MSPAGPHPNRRHVSGQEEGQTKAVRLLRPRQNVVKRASLTLKVVILGCVV